MQNYYVYSDQYYKRKLQFEKENYPVVKGLIDMVC